MPIIRFLGRVLPAGTVRVSGHAPEVKWKMQEFNLEPSFKVDIENSNITVECSIEQFGLSDVLLLADLYKRASDLAKVCVNMTSFATGYGFVVLIDTLVDQNGNNRSINRQEESAGRACTAFSLDPSRVSEFGEVFQMIYTDYSLASALDDVVRAISSHQTQLADCGRALERIRRMINPTLNPGAGWRDMQRTLNVSRDYQEWVTKLSTGPRHGDGTFISGAVCTEVLRRTWVLLNRFIEYRKRERKPLTPPDFPLLV